MNKRQTLLIILFVAVVIFAIVFMTLFFKRGNPIDNSGSAQNKELQSTDKKQEARNTVPVQGTIVSFNGNILEIKNGDVDNKLNVIQNVVVMQKAGDDIRQKTVDDLKAGTDVQANVDASNSMVISIEILND